MRRRSLFLALAAGMIATVAFATPSQAGPTLVTVQGSFAVTGTGAQATDLEFTFSAGTLPAGVIPITVVATNLTGLMASHVGQVERFDFNGIAAGNITFRFLSNNAPADIFLFGVQVTGVTGQVSAVTQQGSIISKQATPEPASLALLGIGMTGFLAFRRFFKKTSVA